MEFFIVETTESQTNNANVFNVIESSNQGSESRK